MRLAENLVRMILFFFGFKECLYFHVITCRWYRAGTAHPLANRQENTITKIRSKIVVCLDPVHSRMHKAAGRRLSKTVHGKWKDSHQADWTATRELSNLKRKWKIQGVVMGCVAQSHQAWEPLPWHHHAKNLYQCVSLFGIWRDPDVVCK